MNARIESQARLRWTVAIVGFLSFPLFLVGAATVGTSGDAALAVERDYERRAEHYGEVIAQREHARVLGWQIHFVAKEGLLQAELKNRDGNPIEAAEIEVEGFALARPDLLMRAAFIGTTAGQYASDLRIDRTGFYKLRGSIQTRAASMAFDVRTWLDGEDPRRVAISR